MNKRIVDLGQQVRLAYSRVHTLKDAPGLGEFRVFPMSTGGQIGNLQRMVQLDLEGGVSAKLAELKVADVEDEVTKSVTRNLVAEIEVAKQRNAVLRAQVEPPDVFREVWAWRGAEGEEDPMNTVLVRPMLNELFRVVQQVTDGTYTLLNPGPNGELPTPAQETAAGKS